MKTKRLALVAVVTMMALFAGGAIAQTSLDVNATAAMNGTNFGMEVTYDGSTNPAFVRDDTPTDEIVYRAAFWYNPNNISSTNNDTVLLRATGETSGAAFQILRVVKFGLCRIWVRTKVGPAITGPALFTGRINIPCDQPAKLQVEWQRSSAAFPTTDGFVRLSVVEGTGTPSTRELTNLNNFNYDVDFTNMGAVGSVDAGTTGSEYFDEFESFRTLAP